MQLEPLTAISPIDGRYAAKTEPLRAIFSEYGLIHHRITVEVRWLQALSQNPEIVEIPVFSKAANNALDDIVTRFDPVQAGRIKEIEKTTRHDIIAFCTSITEQLPQELGKFFHFFR